MSEDAKPIYLETNTFKSCDIKEINGEIFIYNDIYYS